MIFRQIFIQDFVAILIDADLAAPWNFAACVQTRSLQVSLRGANTLNDFFTLKLRKIGHGVDHQSAKRIFLISHVAIVFDDKAHFAFLELIDCAERIEQVPRESVLAGCNDSVAVDEHNWCSSRPRKKILRSTDCRIFQPHDFLVITIMRHGQAANRLALSRERRVADLVLRAYANISVDCHFYAPFAAG